MGLHVGGLVGDDSVSGGMGLVEAVPGELLDVVEDLAGLLRGNVVRLLAALDESCALLDHHLELLLSHGAAQHVGLAERVACQGLGGALHLLLVDHDAVGLFEDRLQFRVVVDDLLLALFALHERGDHVHGAGAIERQDSDDFFDAGGLEVGQDAAHAAGFELEHAHRVRPLKELKRFRVIQRQLHEIHVVAVDQLDQVDCLLQDGEGLEAEKVHLQQTDLLDRLLGVLGDGRAVLVASERYEVYERLVADHHAGCVDAGVAVKALKHLGELHDAAQVGIDIAGRGELRVLGLGLGERDLRILGNHLGVLVRLAERDFEHAGDVADHGLGAESAERDDLRDALFAILLLDVLDGSLAAGLAEVDVEVGG